MSPLTTTATLPFDDVTQTMCTGCLVASAVALLVLGYSVVSYFVCRRQMDCCFNQLLIVFFGIRMVQASQNLVFSSYTVFNAGLPGIACDVNASLEQVLDLAAGVCLVGFFLGMSNPRRFWESWLNRSVYVSAFVLGMISLAVMWMLFLPQSTAEDGDSSNGVNPASVSSPFEQTLAWCWVPSTSPSVSRHYSPALLLVIKISIGYVVPCVAFLLATYAYLSQSSLSGESWLGKSVIRRRFAGVAICQLLPYAVGLCVRIGYTGRPDVITGTVLSMLYPLGPAAVAIVFLWTEEGLGLLIRVLLASCQRRTASRSPPFVDSSGIATDGSRTAASASVATSPRASELSDSFLPDIGSDAAPGTFTATMRTMTCDAVVGILPISSSTQNYSVPPSCYDDISSVRTTDVRFVENGFEYADNPRGITTAGAVATSSPLAIVVTTASEREVVLASSYPEEMNTVRDFHDAVPNHVSTLTRAQGVLSGAPIRGPLAKMRVSSFAFRDGSETMSSRTSLTQSGELARQSLSKFDGATADSGDEPK